MPIAQCAEPKRDPVRDRLHDLRNLFGASGRIIVRVRCAGRRVWIVVADTGSGMSKNCAANALGRLPARPEAEHGTGIGQVRATGGSLHIRSRRGKGTVVAIVLPLLPAEAFPLR